MCFNDLGLVSVKGGYSERSMKHGLFYFLAWILYHHLFCVPLLHTNKLKLWMNMN